MLLLENFKYHVSSPTALKASSETAGGEESGLSSRPPGCLSSCHHLTALTGETLSQNHPAELFLHPHPTEMEMMKWLLF